MNHTSIGMMPQTQGADQGEKNKKKRAAGIVTLRLVLGVLVSLAAIGGFAWIRESVKDRRTDTTALDRAVLTWDHTHQTPWLTELAKGLAFLGSPPVIIAIAVIATIIGFFWRKVRGAAWTMPIAVAGSGLLIQAMKLEFHRPRPTLYTQVIPETGYSFPSGHSLIAVVVYGLLGYFAMHLFRAHAARFAIGTATVVIVLLIGLSRPYVQVHYPTDVLAGWIGGIPWLTTCLSIHEHLTRHFAEAGEPVLHLKPGTASAGPA
jgi:undecaprenyl-diphosphatase